MASAQHLVFLLSVIVCLAPVLQSDAARVEPGTSLDEAAPIDCGRCRDPQGRGICAICDLSHKTSHEPLVDHPDAARVQVDPGTSLDEVAPLECGLPPRPRCPDPKELP